MCMAADEQQPASSQQPSSMAERISDQSAWPDLAWLNWWPVENVGTRPHIPGGAGSVDRRCYVYRNISPVNGRPDIDMNFFIL